MWRGIVLMAVHMATTVEAADRAVVVEPVVNMHSKPSADTDVVSQTRLGTTIVVVRAQADWAEIQTPDGYPGWIRLVRIRRLAEGQSYAESGRTLTTVSLRTHLYPLASVTKRAPLLTAPFETRLEVVEELPGENGRWISVRLPDGRTAWLQRGDVEFDTKPASIAQLVELSKLFLGLPYTWGGTSSFGYDCSGFVQMLCRRAGVGIPRDAQPQADWSDMAKVQKADLQPGDLLYFGSSDRKITHTGFYLGNGEFIHSTTNHHPVLQVSRLAEEHWTKLFVAARRWKK
jgi:cell wall-associated NlpC family hydrolase